MQQTKCPLTDEQIKKMWKDLHMCVDIYIFIFIKEIYIYIYTQQLKRKKVPVVNNNVLKTLYIY